MMADSIEHVISYWMMFQKFQSPGARRIRRRLALAAVPAVFGLCRGASPTASIRAASSSSAWRCFMVVSVGWGCCSSPTRSRCGTRWCCSSCTASRRAVDAGEQLFIHDIVGRDASCTSAVRLTATARWLGLLMGPAVGGVILLVLGPDLRHLRQRAASTCRCCVWLWKAPLRTQRTRRGRRQCAASPTSVAVARESPAIAPSSR